jgi:zinc protease
MKALYMITAALFSVAFAQQGATQGLVKEYNVNGLKVIHKQVPKQVISVRLYVKGGTANYDKQLEGVENFAFNLATTGGTKTKTKTAFLTEAEKIGANFSGNSGYDAGFMGVTCLKTYWNESWALFADAVLNPAMDAREFDLLREKLIANSRQEETSPDNTLSRLAMSNTFGGTNYEKRPAGSPESLAAITLENVKNHYNSVLNKGNCFLVIVGDLTEAEVKAKVKSFDKLAPASTVSKPPHRPLTVVEPKVYVENRELETNYIMGRMPAPAKGSQEGVANILAMNILNDRFFTELRTKRSLSYAPSAFAAGSVQHPSNGVYISTTDPKQSMEVMVDEINKAVNHGFTEKELRDKKQTFLTYHYMGEETVDAQAGAIGNAEIAGNWNYSQEFTNMVNQTNVGDLNRVFKKYVNQISWTYLGKEDQVRPEMFLQPKADDPIRD